MKKLIVLAAVLPLMTLGCDWGKKTPPKTTGTDTSLAQPAPQPYVPPTGTGAMADTSNPGTVVTPLKSEDLNPQPMPMGTGTGKTGGHTGGHSSHVSKPTLDTASTDTMKDSTKESTKIGSTYKVKTGDSLSEIAAKKYGKGNVKKGIAAIKKANKLKSDVIRVGQTLKIPTLS